MPKMHAPTLLKWSVLLTILRRTHNPPSPPRNVKCFACRKSEAYFPQPQRECVLLTQKQARSPGVATENLFILFWNFLTKFCSACLLAQPVEFKSIFPPPHNSVNNNQTEKITATFKKHLHAHPPPTNPPVKLQKDTRLFLLPSRQTSQIRDGGKQQNFLLPYSCPFWTTSKSNAENGSLKQFGQDNSLLIILLSALE